MKLNKYNKPFGNTTGLPKGNSLNFMWSIDKDFNFISTNQTLNNLIKNLTGKTTLKGNNIEQLELALSGLKLNLFKSNCERAFNGESFTEIVFMQPPVEIWMEISYHPIWRGNDIVCCACYFHDITERKITEQEIFRINSQLISFQSNLPAEIEEEQNRISEEINFGIQQQLLSLTNDISSIGRSGNVNR